MLFGKRTAAVFALCACATPTASAEPNEIQRAWQDFVAKYGRVFHSVQEESRRFEIFEKNYMFIKSENAVKGRNFTLVVNGFADQAPEEFGQGHLGMRAPPAGQLRGRPLLGTHRYSGATLPASVDWVAGGAVTPVKNQGSCGSCWSFSTTGALEGAWQIKTGKLVSLSEQQLVDCSTENNGCHGGDMDTAFEFLERNNACTESSYGYNATQGTCHAAACEVAIPTGSVTGYYDVPVDDTKALMEAVSQQPVSVGIEADQTAFQLYGGGVLTKECGNNLDHGVLVVGYGTENGVDYWKVKNSWGASWGEHGYLRIERGLPGDGKCGIKARASYPKVSPASPSPAPSPTPAPTPTPTPPGACDDSSDLCRITVRPEKDCEVLASECKKTCGCCGASPPSWCEWRSQTVVV